MIPLNAAAARAQTNFDMPGMLGEVFILLPAQSSLYLLGDSADYYGLHVGPTMRWQ